MISLTEQVAVAEDRWNSVVAIRATTVLMHIGWTLVCAVMILTLGPTTGCGGGADDDGGSGAVPGNPNLDVRVVAASYATSAEGIARIGPGEELKDPSGRAWYVSSTAVITTHYLEGGQARVERSDLTGSQPRWMVVVPLSGDGARRLRKWTQDNINRGFGIIIDGELVFAGIVGGVFGSPLMIDGDYNKGEAEALAATLRTLSRRR